MKTIKDYILELEDRLQNMEDAYNELKATTQDIKAIVTDIKNLEFGNWEIKNNQMFFYDLEGAELAKFDLFDKFGKPSEINVFKRERNDT